MRFPGRKDRLDISNFLIFSFIKLMNNRTELSSFLLSMRIIVANALKVDFYPK